MLEDPIAGTSWQAALAETAFPPAGNATVVLNGWHVLIARTDAGYRAINDRCTHAAAQLSTGRIRRGIAMCPLHGARFDLATGKCLGGAYADVRVFALRLVNGTIEVAVPEAKPQMNDLPFSI